MYNAIWEDILVYVCGLCLFCKVFYFCLLCSGGSANNLYAEDEDEIEASPSADQIIDNSITRIKMKLLKSKMESMDLNKKVF